MPRVERSATIAVPPERAFDYVADAGNALKWMHNFSRFDPERPGSRGLGARVNATGLVMGSPITTTLEIVEFDPPRRLASRTTGRLKSYSIWEFAPAEGGTRVTFSGEYDVPGGLLRVIGGPLVQRELETNAEISLRNLKAVLEATA
jgi:carbon monoxide dehydrogenase subunit G